MRAVLREARLPDRYFGESFKSMEDLLAAVLHDISVEVFVRISECFDPGVPPAEQVRHLFGNLVRTLEEDPGAARIKFVEVTGVSPYIDRLRLAALKPYVEATYARLPEPLPDSRLDRMIFAQAYVSGVNGMLVDWANGTLPPSSYSGSGRTIVLMTAAEMPTTHRPKISPGTTYDGCADTLAATTPAPSSTTTTPTDTGTSSQTAGR